MLKLIIALCCICTLSLKAQIPTGSVLWLKADAGVTLNGNSVTNWADQSGNAYNVTQATAANQPTFEASVFNGQHAISFDGGDWLNNTISNGLYIVKVLLADGSIVNTKLIKE